MVEPLMRMVQSLALAIVTLGCLGGHSLALEYRGGVVLPLGSALDGQVVGGLSGVVYDPARELYYVLSDARGEHGPARFYTMRIDVADGFLDEDVKVWAADGTLLAHSRQLALAR